MYAAEGIGQLRKCTGRPFGEESFMEQMEERFGRRLFNKYRNRICPGAFEQRDYVECIRCVRVNHGLLKSVPLIAVTLMKKPLCRKARINFADSDHVRKRLGLRDTRVILYGIPRVEARNPGTREDGPLEFGYVGRFTAEKGLFLLLDAAAILSARGLDFRLSFIGDGPMKPALQQKGEALGLESRMRFTGFLRGPELDHSVRSLDVVIMPSIWEEPAGLSAIEQMMRGGALIATDVAGLGEMVGDGGLKFPLGDAAGLAAQIERLFDPALRALIGRRARDRAQEKFQLERMIDEHIELLKAARR